MARFGLGQIAAVLHTDPRRRAARRIALLAALTLTSAVQAGSRVVSINLCTDQLLLSLADPDQIVGLSPYARDPARSWAAHEAARFPVLSGTAEDVITLKPDLVLAGRYTKRATRDLLKALGFRVEEFDPVVSIADAKDQIRRAGALLDHPDRAQRQIVAIDAAGARAVGVAGARTRSALVLQRRGWVSGRNTLTDSLLSAVGLRNAAASLGTRVGQVSVEEVIELKPDLLLVANTDGSAEDQGGALLLHPALQALYPLGKRLVMPEMLTVCGGPMLAEALDRLSAEIERLR